MKNASTASSGLAQLLFDSDNLRVHLHATLRLLEMEWQGFCSGNSLRDSIRKALTLARQHRVGQWLNNALQMRTLRAADLQWLRTVLTTEFADLGIQRFAVILPHDAMARMSLDALLTPFDVEGSPTELCRFHVRGKALEWLAEPAASVPQKRSTT